MIVFTIICFTQIFHTSYFLIEKWVLFWTFRLFASMSLDSACEVRCHNSCFWNSSCVTDWCQDLSPDNPQISSTYSTVSSWAEGDATFGANVSLTGVILAGLLSSPVRLSWTVGMSGWNFDESTINEPFLGSYRPLRERDSSRPYRTWRFQLWSDVLFS
jgi:hypothetical protein